MVLLFLGFTGVLMVLLCIYLYVIFKRLFGLFLKSRHSRLTRALSLASAVLVTIPSVNLFGVWALVALYFTAACACMDIIRLILKKVGCKPRGGWLGWKGWKAAYQSGAAAAVATAAVLGYAYINMHQITVAEYTVHTEKNIRQEGYRLVFLSDLHFGTTMGREKLEECCRRMEKERPDLVILGGDIVDEAASTEEVADAFEALASIESTYGAYYVYGNHDKGKYARNCDFTAEELADAILGAGVRILEDDTVTVSDGLSISGRRDRSDVSMGQGMRMPSEMLLRKTAPNSFHIIVDHQPRDMEENADVGFDLMLSGHTHAGQMWPVGVITELFDKGTVNYGEKDFGAMKLVVSSGIGGWGYPLRTGRHSEYVVVTIT